ncbi:MAG: hypothetical protein R3F07_15920 [Opitutaceae bacterium]
MNNHRWIPKKTLEKLDNPASSGARHQQIIEISSSLVSCGFGDDQIFTMLRPNYDSGVSDSEILSIIKWARAKIGTNPANGFRPLGRIAILPPNQRRPSPSRDAKPRINPVCAIHRYLEGKYIEEADLWEISPIRPLDSYKGDAFLLISNLFKQGEMVNIVSQCRFENGKATPLGYGETLTRGEWLSRIRNGKLPNGKAGVWIRPNPMDGRGVSDENVTSFRYLLVEFDEIPLSDQLPFVARLRLPISAIISSGGKSFHAWVRIAAKDRNDFRKQANLIFKVLAPYGLDTSNKNPSRLSRLPGVHREIGGKGDNRQRLIYLNPNPTIRRIFE